MSELATVYCRADVEVAGPSLSLGCNRTAFAVDLSDWTTDGVPMINSLFIECSNEFNTTCVSSGRPMIQL